MNHLTCNPIGFIRTPYKTVGECPRNLMTDGPPCQLVIDREFADGLFGLGQGVSILILYWMDQASLGSLIQTSRQSGDTRGIFALRTPNRPNPIGAAVTKIDNMTDNEITVRGLDCINGTPLLDIKPAMVTEVEHQTGRNKYMFWRK